MISRSIYNLKIYTICPICMCDIPFDRSILQLSNGIRHVMPSTDRKLELTANASMAQPVSQPAVCSNGLKFSCSSAIIWDSSDGYKRRIGLLSQCWHYLVVENWAGGNFPMLLYRAVNHRAAGYSWTYWVDSEAYHSVLSCIQSFLFIPAEGT
jgi:hypothetical protein